MAFRWRSDDGSTLNAGWVILLFSSGVLTSISKDFEISKYLQSDNGANILFQYGEKMVTGFDFSAQSLKIKGFIWRLQRGGCAFSNHPHGIFPLP